MVCSLFSAFLLIAFFSSQTTRTVYAEIRRYRWEFQYQFKAPDCNRKLAIAINGKTPGPTILAQQGDTIIVELKNSLLTENVAIHWRGIRQIETPGSNGTEGVSQCPITPGDTFVYKLVVDRPGTYLYHANDGMQRQAGLFGSIRVSVADGANEPFTYDYDRSIILTDWWHKSTYEQVTGQSSIPFQWVNEPELQGKGRFNCSLVTPCSSNSAAICNTFNPACGPYVLTVVPGKTYRLRIGSLTSLSALNFGIEGHNMKVVEADGHYVEPFFVKDLLIYSGETYSVLVKADQDPSRSYWATTNVVGRRPNTPTGLAIFNYYQNNPRKLPTTTPPTGPLWNDTNVRVAQSLKIKSHKDYIHQPPLPSDRLMIILSTQNRINGFIGWSINNVSFSLPHTPNLVLLKENLTNGFNQTPPPKTYDYANYGIFSIARDTNATSSNSIYRLKFNSTVDIILQNANTMNSDNGDTHPWHLHGSHFWVLGHGNGVFNPVNDTKKYNLVDPIMKNTVPVHPYGWTALRFRADNPSVWAFHGHIEAHFFLGIGVVFEEGMEKVGKLPSSTLGCGEKKGFKRP